MKQEFTTCSQQALQVFRDAYGSRIASVVHLAAYFDFTGEDMLDALLPTVTEILIGEAEAVGYGMLRRAPQAA